MEHAEGPTVARAVARRRGASTSAGTREVYTRAPKPSQGTVPAGDPTTPTSYSTEDYLRHEEHALCTAVLPLAMPIPSPPSSVRLVPHLFTPLAPLTAARHPRAP